MGHTLILHRGKMFLVFVKCDKSVRTTLRTESTTRQAKEWKGSETEREEVGTDKPSKGKSQAGHARHRLACVSNAL